MREVDLSKPIIHQDGTATFLGGRRRALAVLFGRNNQFEDQTAWMEILQGANLPLKPVPDSIAGWGSCSIAFGIQTRDGSRYVAVLGRRLTFDKRFQERLHRGFTDSQQTTAYFDKYLLPQSVLIVPGLNREVSSLKISPEVNGDTLSNLSEWVLGNRELLRQYLDFSGRNLRLFFERGMVIDTVGHIKRHFLTFLFELAGFLPFNSSNLMVDYTKNKLILVDHEPIRFETCNLNWKMIWLAKIAGSGAMTAALGTILAAHRLRDKLFSLPTDREGISSQYPEVTSFNSGLEDIIGILDASSLDYRIVGSVAIAAWINAAGGDYYLTPRRRNGSQRDIDVLLLDAATSEVLQLQRLFRQKARHNPSYPDVQFHKILPYESYDSNKEFRTPLPPNIHSKIAEDREGNPHLVFRDLSADLPPNYLAPIIRNYEGVRFPTIAPGVLAGLALARGGAIRAKDIDKITLLLSLNQAQVPREFLDFARTLRTGFPGRYQNFLFREFIYHFSGGYIFGGRLKSVWDGLRQKLFPSKPVEVARQEANI